MLNFIQFGGLKSHLAGLSRILSMSDFRYRKDLVNIGQMRSDLTDGRICRIIGQIPSNTVGIGQIKSDYVRLAWLVGFSRT